MYSCGRVLLAVIVLSTAMISCAQLPFRPLHPGEMRLVRIEVPESMEEGMKYEAVLTMRTDTPPAIRQACFRFLAEVPSVAHSSMYWYNYEASSDEPIGSARSRWLDEGPYRDFSNPLCVGGDQIRVIGPDRVSVGFQAKGIKPTFNALECYVEYVVNGQLKETNRVVARITRTE
jgi:hypothetical protein